VNKEQLETESKKIIDNLQGIDINADKERNRQAEIIKQKLEEKKNRKDPSQIANDIIDSYQDSKLAYSNLYYLFI
jgi:ABC-type phosphate transport system auxiliary subunit